MPVTLNGQPINKRVLLTTDDIATWEVEAKALRDQIRELHSQVAAIEAKLAAAAVFMGGAAGEAQPKEDAAKPPRINLARPMTAYVRELFSEGVSLNAKDVVATLAEHPETAKRVRDNANNVYTSLARLAERGVLNRDENGLYSLPKANEPPSGISAGDSGAGEGVEPSLNLQPQAHPVG